MLASAVRAVCVVCVYVCVFLMARTHTVSGVRRFAPVTVTDNSNFETLKTAKTDRCGRRRRPPRRRRSRLQRKVSRYTHLCVWLGALHEGGVWAQILIWKHT